MIIETPKQKAQRDYNAAMDSVNLLAGEKPESMSDAEWADCKQRNIDHLQIQIDKGAEYYGTLDLTPFKNAIK